jgi:hypothetical protein
MLFSVLAGSASLSRHPLRPVDLGSSGLVLAAPLRNYVPSKLTIPPLYRHFLFDAVHIANGHSYRSSLVQCMWLTPTTTASRCWIVPATPSQRWLAAAPRALGTAGAPLHSYQSRAASAPAATVRAYPLLHCSCCLLQLWRAARARGSGCECELGLGGKGSSAAGYCWCDWFACAIESLLWSLPLWRSHAPSSLFTSKGATQQPRAIIIRWAYMLCFRGHSCQAICVCIWLRGPCRYKDNERSREPQNCLPCAGTILVADTNNSLIRQFDPATAQLTTLDLKGVPPPRLSPDAAAAAAQPSGEQVVLTAALPVHELVWCFCWARAWTSFGKPAGFPLWLAVWRSACVSSAVHCSAVHW